MYGERALAARLLIAAFAVAAGLVHAAQITLKTYAQELVDRTAAANPRLLVVVMHVTPPGAAQNVIIASNIGRIGKAADRDDLRAVESGEAHLEVGHGGRRFEVELPLYDASRTTIGALGLVWKYHSGEPQAPLERHAEKIRDALARRILNKANLLDAYPFVPGATTKTHAQKLVDEALARHADVIVLALRGPVKGREGIVVLGSTFGRHGKPADADDLKVMRADGPTTGVYSEGRRFGVDLPLHDARGAVFGTMNVGYALHEGDDTQALLAHAVALREEIQKWISSADSLEKLDP